MPDSFDQVIKRLQVNNDGQRPSEVELKTKMGKAAVGNNDSDTERTEASTAEKSGDLQFRKPDQRTNSNQNGFPSVPGKSMFYPSLGKTARSENTEQDILLARAMQQQEEAKSITSAPALSDGAQNKHRKWHEYASVKSAPPLPMPGKKDSSIRRRYGRSSSLRERNLSTERLSAEGWASGILRDISVDHRLPEPPSKKQNSGTGVANGRGRSTHADKEGIPRSVVVKNPPEFTEQQQRAPTGLVEMYPGTFVHIHSTRKAWDAIAKGTATIVKCRPCGKRFQIAQSAKVLYCTNCKSLTPVEAKQFEDAKSNTDGNKNRPQADTDDK